MHPVLLKARQLLTQELIAQRLCVSLKTVQRWESVPDLPVRHVAALEKLVLPEIPSSIGEFKFIDLFAGIGGCRLAFEQSGGECVFTSEWNKYSQKTYSSNFHVDVPISGDITKINSVDIPDHDVLIAGFPCQPFSIAGVSKKNSLGKSHGFDCATQGTLFFEIERIISEKRPAAFLLENVKNLKSHDKGNTFKIIMHTLQEKLGYYVPEPIVVDARNFVPQHRERVFIAGFRKKVPFSWADFCKPDVAVPKLGDILHPGDGSQSEEPPFTVGSKAKVDLKYTLSGHLWQYLQDYAKKHKEKGNGFGCSVVGVGDVSRTLSARYYKDGSEILISNGKNKIPRRLTPRECARLMGFPDTYKIVVSDTQAYKQFGNSVVVPVVAEVARIMKPCVLSIVKKSDSPRAPLKGKRVFEGYQASLPF